MIVSCALAARANEPLLPWATNTQPTDVARSHVEEITTSPHHYKVMQAGTMDGRNCRSPMGCGIAREGALLQTWESNRSVRMENVGEADIVNPWLSNGRNNFRNVAEIVSSAITPGMTDAEKAFALWFQEIRYRHHSAGDNNELRRPGEGLQHLRLQHLRQRLDQLWPRSGARPASRRRRPGPSGIAFPRPSTTTAGISMTATCTPSISCATTRPWPANRTSCATTTWSSAPTPRASSCPTPGGMGRGCAPCISTKGQSRGSAAATPRPR